MPYTPAAQTHQPIPNVDGMSPNTRHRNTVMTITDLASQWEEAFQSHEVSRIVSADPEAVTEDRQTFGSEDSDELARAAGSLIEAVRHEQNPKFQNSAFLGLMKQLRDREVVVEGNQMVPKEEASGWASDFQSSVGTDMKGKGKGRAVDIMDQPITSTMLPSGSSIPLQQSTATASEQRTDNGDQVRESLLSVEEEIDAYFQQENDAYIGYWHGPTPPRSMTPKENAEWGRLQRDWDSFEATATGIRPVANYQFQSNNPYVLGEASRHHMLHSQERTSLYDVSCRPILRRRSVLTTTRATIECVTNGSGGAARPAERPGVVSARREAAGERA